MIKYRSLLLLITWMNCNGTDPLGSSDQFLDEILLHQIIHSHILLSRHEQHWSDGVEQNTLHQTLGFAEWNLKY